MGRTKKLITVTAEALGPIVALLFTWAIAIHEVVFAGLINCLAMGVAAIAEKTYRDTFPRAKRKPRWAIISIGIGAFCVLAIALVDRQNQDLQMAGFTLSFTFCLIWWAVHWTEVKKQREER